MNNRNQTHTDFDKTVADFDKTINTRPATRGEVAYRNGYLQGRAAQQHVRYRSQEDWVRRREIQDTNHVASGVVFGIVLACLAGAAVSVMSFVNQRNGVAPANSAGVVQPSSAQPQTAPVQRQTTIIDRTIERVREIIPTTPPEIQKNAPASEQTSGDKSSAASASQNVNSEAVNDGNAAP